MRWPTRQPGFPHVRWRQVTAAGFARRWRWLQLDGIGVGRARIEWSTPARDRVMASVLIPLPDDGAPMPGVSSASLWTHRFGGSRRPMLDSWEVHPTGDGRTVLIVIDWRLT